MKTWFEDPTLCIVLFDLRDVLTESDPDNPDDVNPGGELSTTTPSTP